MTTQPQNWFRHNEAADYCRISPRTLRRWRDAGRIRAYGGKYFRDDLDRAVRNESPITDNEVLKPRDVVRVNLMTGVEKIIGAPEASTSDLLAALQASVDRARRGPQYLEPDTSVGPPEHEGDCPIPCGGPNDPAHRPTDKPLPGAMVDQLHPYTPVHSPTNGGLCSFCAHPEANRLHQA